MTDENKREKDLGSGLLEDARKKINKKRDALAEAAEEAHEPETRRNVKRYGN